MDTLKELYQAYGADPQQAGLAFALMVGIAFVLVAWGVMTLSAGLSDPRRRRLRAMMEPEQRTSAKPPKYLPGWLANLQPFLQPRSDVRRVELQVRLRHAGFSSELALALLYLAKLVFLLVLPALVLAAGTTWPHPRLTPGMLYTLATIAGFLGWLIPNMYIDRRAEGRKQVLMHSLPDALDLMVACTEAGLGLNAAIQRVADQLPASHPELAVELALVNAEMRAGMDRVDTLRRLADRTGLDDIRGLVSLMTQSMRYGTSIADTLRIYAEDLRDKRMQRAEETAATIGTRLIFPLCICIFPAFFVVATGPAVVGVIRVLSGVEWPGQP